MKLLYYAQAAWEQDYLIHDVFEDKMEVEHIPVSDTTSLLTRVDELRDNCALVVNIRTNYAAAMVISAILHPRVIVILSDEGASHTNLLDLSRYTRLLLHQYCHRHISYPTNAKQLPLGYVSGYLEGRSSLDIVHRSPSTRTNTCAFVGQIKSDRKHMLSVFLRNMDRVLFKPVSTIWNLQRLTVGPSELFATYSNAIFVPNGRGNCSLDCFRLYEAVVAGAIPVLVGSHEEVRTTFYYGGRLPPFIIKESWEEACRACKELMEDADALQERQDQVQQWWRDVMMDIRGGIAAAMA